MYLLYIDDSGTCNLKRDENYGPDGGESRFFVLGAVLIKADELNKIEKELNDIRLGCLGNDLAEIKSSISKKLNCPITCGTNPDKNCFRTVVANLISNTNCTLFAVSQDQYKTTSNGVVTSKNDIYRLAFENLLKLVDNYMFNNKINESTITFIDKKNSGNSTDTLIYNAYKSALKNKKIFKSFNNELFSPTINIVYSQYTSGAQLADFVAGSIWKALENFENKERLIEAKRITNIIKHKFYSCHNTPIGYGYSTCSDWLK